jgi:hypothetical protein
MATRSAWTRPGFLAAGIFLALVAVLATITALNRGNGHTGRPAAAGPTPRTAMSPPSATAPSQSTGCAPNGTAQTAPAAATSASTSASQAAPTATPSTAPTATPSAARTATPSAVPTTTPSDVPWTLYKGVAVPMSKTDGPLLVSGDVARCYADAPLGAVIAAWQFVTRAVCGDDWRSVVAQEAVPGPDANAFVAAHQSGRVQCGGSSGGGHVQLAGFSVVGYSPQLAVVQLAERSPQNALAAMSVTMRWQDGDWKVAFQPGGAMAAGWHPIDNLDGLIPWTGV